MDSCMPIYYTAYMPDKLRFSLHIRAGFNYWSTMSVTFFGYGGIIFVRFEVPFSLLLLPPHLRRLYLEHHDPMSIGYGDIFFVRFEEYIFGIFHCISLRIHAASM